MTLRNFFAAIALLFGLSIVAVCLSPADVRELEQIAAMTSKSKEAKAVFAAYLSRNPAPNRLEAAEASRLVNEVLVRETTVAVTGGPPVQAVAVDEVKQIVSEEDRQGASIVFKIMVALLAMASISALVSIFKKMKN